MTGNSSKAAFARKPHAAVFGMPWMAELISAGAALGRSHAVDPSSSVTVPSGIRPGSARGPISPIRLLPGSRSWEERQALRASQRSLLHSLHRRPLRKRERSNPTASCASTETQGVHSLAIYVAIDTGECVHRNTPRLGLCLGKPLFIVFSVSHDDVAARQKDAGIFDMSATLQLEVPCALQRRAPSECGHDRGHEHPALRTQPGATVLGRRSLEGAR